MCRLYPWSVNETRRKESLDYANDGRVSKTCQDASAVIAIGFESLQIRCTFYTRLSASCELSLIVTCIEKEGL